jgi:hypothetical protein
MWSGITFISSAMTLRMLWNFPKDGSNILFIIAYICCIMIPFFCYHIARLKADEFGYNFIKRSHILNVMTECCILFVTFPNIGNRWETFYVPEMDRIILWMVYFIFTLINFFALPLIERLSRINYENNMNTRNLNIELY